MASKQARSKPGRRPKPTRQKLAEGNPGKRAINVFDINRPIEDCPIPSHLDERARIIFAFFRDELVVDGMLLRRDAMLLGNLAQAYSTLIGAQQLLNSMPEEKRYLMKTPSGYMQQNPLLGIVNTQMDRIGRIAVEFGLSPSSRTNFDEDMLERIRLRAVGGKGAPVDDLETLLAQNGPAAAAIN